MKYTYLLIDLFTILVPLLFSFHPRLLFYKTWRAFLPSLLTTGTLFVIWDSYFTRLGVWGFNTRYLIGSKVGNLPVEEVLFFLCIPYSCLFTFFCIAPLLRDKLSNLGGQAFSSLLILISAVVAIAEYDRLYTLFAFSFLLILLITGNYFLKFSWLKEFYLTYCILLIPFVIVNGLLTGTGLAAPVVWYNNNQITDLRIMTIPIEDFFYGIDLVLLNTMIYNYLKQPE